MKSADFFDAENHPVATFVSTAVRPNGDAYLLDGNLTIKGNTRPVTLNLEFNGVSPGMGNGEVSGYEASVVINRKDFKCWGQMPPVNSPEYKDWLGEVRKFGKAIWDITGKGVNVDMVFEHPGESTFPVSVQVVKKGGMVVICAGTTGYNLTMDARYLWMHQKRVQGSHFANLKQASAANQLMLERRIDPCMSEVFPWAEIPDAHVKMRRNEHKPGNMAVLISSPRIGLRTFADAIEASRALRSA